MKSISIIHLFLTTITLISFFGLWSCKEKNGAKKSTIQKKEKVDSAIVINTESEKFVQFNEDGTSEEIFLECIRAQAMPMVIKSVYPNTTFELLSDSVTGIEKINFSNGDKLIIENGGCEYFVLTFKFETSRFQSDTSDAVYWFSKSIVLMKEILPGINSPLNLEYRLNDLQKFIDADKINNFKNLKIGEEIEPTTESFGDYIMLEKVEKLQHKKYAIEITFVSKL